jgi:HEAT repeat protein
MRVAAGVLAVVATLAVAAPAGAHGGQYKSPAVPGDGDPETTVKGGTSANWTDWWWAHRDRYLDLARRLRRRDAAVAAKSAGGLGASADVGPNPTPREAPGDPRAYHERVVLPAVLEALRSGEAEIRSAAAVALGKMGFPRALLDLEKALGDGHPDVRDGAVLALGMLKDDIALPSLRRILFDPAARERSRSFAALGMGLSGGAEATGHLLRFLSPRADEERVGGVDRTDDLVAAAILALGHTRAKEAAPALRRLYASATALDTVPRSCAAVALARLEDRDALPLLLKGIRHPEAVMRQSAAVALGVLGSPGDGPVLEALAKASGDGDEGTRQFAIMALGRVGGADARAFLRRRVEDASRGEDRSWLLLALAVAGDAEGAPILRRWFREDAFSRPAAALALGILGDREAIPLLREQAFAKGDALPRGACITALALLEDAPSVPSIRNLLASEADPRLRFHAAVALGVLGDEGAVSALASLARGGGSVHVRSHSCYFLGLVGNREAAEVLVAVASDGKEKMAVRMHAVAGLGVLADRSPLPVLSGLGRDGNFRMPLDVLREVAAFL